MMNYATLFPNYQIVAPVVRQLSWSRFVEVIGIKVLKYMTELPSREVLQRQIQKSLIAKARFENCIEEDEE